MVAAGRQCCAQTTVGTLYSRPNVNRDNHTLVQTSVGTTIPSFKRLSGPPYPRPNDSRDHHTLVQTTVGTTIPSSKRQSGPPCSRDQHTIVQRQSGAPYPHSNISQDQHTVGTTIPSSKRQSGPPYPRSNDSRDHHTLVRLITDRVALGTTILSDCWKAYSALSQHGYMYLTVNHRILDPGQGMHTNTCECMWFHAKSHMRRGTSRTRTDSAAMYVALSGKR